MLLFHTVFRHIHCILNALNNLDVSMWGRQVPDTFLCQAEAILKSSGRSRWQGLRLDPALSSHEWADRVPLMPQYGHLSSIRTNSIYSKHIANCVVNKDHQRMILDLMSMIA